MGDWPLQGDGQRFEAAGADTSASKGTAVTSSATVNTKGSYAPIIASTAFDAAGFYLVITNTAVSQADYDCLMDIAVGAEGLEQVIVSNYLYKQSNADYIGRSVYFPISIPAGTRIAARWQQDSVASGEVADVTVILVGASFIPSKPLQRCTTYGAVTADTGGVTVDPGGTANTKGDYSEITSSSTNPIKHLILGFGSNSNGSMTESVWLVDIAVGAEESEQVLIANIPLISNSGENMFWVSSFPCHIPAGTRISARAQCSIIDATDRLFDIAIYGID